MQERKKRKIVWLTLLLFVFGTTSLFAQGTTPSNVVDTGSTAWMMISTALVLLMVPGLAMFYGGLVRTKNVLGTMMHSFAAMGIITILWVSVGYAMSFGNNVLGGWCGWNSDFFMLQGLDQAVHNGIPDYIFVMFQGKFAIITPALIAGAFAERISFKAYCIFIILWSLLVYNPLCHWVWASDGFLFKMGAKGAIDFAGGTVVHISSGISGLVVALFIGIRRGVKLTSAPTNLVMTMMGAGLLWVGWFGFNAGSSLSSGLASAQALTVTQVSAAAGAVTWMLIEAFHQGKGTALGFASGVLAGLVAITPAAGVVTPIGAMALGFLASCVCYWAISMKSKLGYDDSLDAFGVHGVGGITGAIALVFFIRKQWFVDAASTIPGWNVWNQLGVQLTAVGIAIAYAAIVTFIILWVMSRFINIRSTPAEELQGMDYSYHGERGYGMLNAN
jgi:Amt family ammonium transporter